MKKNRELWIKIKNSETLIRASAIEAIAIFNINNKYYVDIKTKSGDAHNIDSFYTQDEAEECRTEFLRLMAYPKKFMIVSAK